MPEAIPSTMICRLSEAHLDAVSGFVDTCVVSRRVIDPTTPTESDNAQRPPNETPATEVIGLVVSLLQEIADASSTIVSVTLLTVVNASPQLFDELRPRPRSAVENYLHELALVVFVVAIKFLSS